MRWQYKLLWNQGKNGYNAITKLSYMIIASFAEGRNFVRKSNLFVKDKAKVAMASVLLTQSPERHRTIGRLQIQHRPYCDVATRQLSLQIVGY